MFSDRVSLDHLVRNVRRRSDQESDFRVGSGWVGSGRVTALGQVTGRRGRGTAPGLTAAKHRPRNGDVRAVVADQFSTPRQVEASR